MPYVGISHRICLLSRRFLDRCYPLNQDTILGDFSHRWPCTYFILSRMPNPWKLIVLVDCGQGSHSIRRIPSESQHSSAHNIFGRPLVLVWSWRISLAPTSGMYCSIIKDNTMSKGTKLLTRLCRCAISSIIWHSRLISTASRQWIIPLNWRRLQALIMSQWGAKWTLCGVKRHYNFDTFYR